MKKLIQYLIGKPNRRKGIPHLRTSLKNSFDVGDLDADTELILLKGIVRDPYEANRLLDKHGASSAPELFRILPPPKRSTWRDRLANWIRLLEGSSKTDPHLREWKEAKERYRG